MSAKIKYLEPLVNHLLAQNSSEAMEKTLRDLLTVGELADAVSYTHLTLPTTSP